jgi:nitrate/TMAO reductase-like tetraheme cytochrome c subunit
MKKLPVLSLFAISFFLLSAASKYPNFEISCSKGKTAKACLNQTVTLKAQMVRSGGRAESYNQVLQHPMMTNPFENWKQSYTVISQNMGQIVVLTKKDISCPQTHPKVELKGKFSLYELQCHSENDPEDQDSQVQQKQAAPMTGMRKCDYSGHVIRVDSFKCLKN